MNLVKAVKISIEIEAVKWDGSKAVMDFINSEWSDDEHWVGLSETGGLFVDTLEGVMQANVGDWVIKGVEGEIYPCKPSIFSKTYKITYSQI